MGISQNELDHYMNRETYDLSHWTFNCGLIGCLQTIGLIPVMAGDSLKIDYNAVFRLSPLRRNMYLDAHIDLFAFYIPHRHIYGQNWVDFIKQGINETVTLGTRSLTAELNCCGTLISAGTVPKWIPEGYLQIWNRYFKLPTDVDKAMSYFDARATGDPDNNFGLTCGFMPRLWNQPVDGLATNTDKRVSLVDTDKIDLVDIANKQGVLESVRQREFFARRYVDVMGNIFGASVNTDADQRPTLLMHAEHWLSGYDVDGTTDTTLGTFSGKGATAGGISIPFRFMPEHGTVWLMALVRFPSVHTKERLYLAGKPEPTYAQISGDPNILKRQAPVTLDLREYFNDPSFVSDNGLVPYGQWYREHPNHVHPQYEVVSGHPFLTQSLTDKYYARYIDTNEYDDIFSTLQLKHWQVQGYAGVQVKRLVPDPRTSIFAGSV